MNYIDLLNNAVKISEEFDFDRGVCIKTYDLYIVTFSLDTGEIIEFEGVNK